MKVYLIFNEFNGYGKYIYPPGSEKKSSMVLFMKVNFCRWFAGKIKDYEK